jgi:hypothetical protein
MLPTDTKAVAVDSELQLSGWNCGAESGCTIYRLACARKGITGLRTLVGVFFSTTSESK